MVYKNGLSVITNKMDLVIFMKKNRLGNFQLPRLNNTVMGKYVQSTLDNSLIWTRHIKNKAEKVCKNLWACRRAFGNAWRQRPNMVRWLYMSVMRPPPPNIVACNFWCTATTNYGQEIVKIQRMACLSVLGAMMNAPLRAMDVILELPPLDVFIRGLLILLIS